MLRKKTKRLKSWVLTVKIQERKKKRATKFSLTGCRVKATSDREII